jgi:uncharacterized protein YndB with AHSA1/START domain
MASRELTLTRTFDAPQQLVWDAYTVPEQIAQWWGPNGMHTPLEKITVELREGGAFNLTMVDWEGREYPSEMTIRSLSPIDQLVYGWGQQRGLDGGEITVTLSDDGGKTRLVQHFVGEVSDEMFPMMEQGTNEQLDKLAGLLA